jgi:hypothetical protein
VISSGSAIAHSFFLSSMPLLFAMSMFVALGMTFAGFYDALVSPNGQFHKRVVAFARTAIILLVTCRPVFGLKGMLTSGLQVCSQCRIRD